MNTIILQAATSGSGGGTSQMILLIGMMVIFYVFMILPQTRKRKKQAAFVQSISTGTKIVTNSGIHGKISKRDDSTVLIELEDGQKMKIERSAISMDLTEALNKA